MPIQDGNQELSQTFELLPDEMILHILLVGGLPIKDKLRFLAACQRFRVLGFTEQFILKCLLSQTRFFPIKDLQPVEYGKIEDFDYLPKTRKFWLALVRRVHERGVKKIDSPLTARLMGAPESELGALVERVFDKPIEYGEIYHDVHLLRKNHYRLFREIIAVGEVSIILIVIERLKNK